MGEKKKGEGKKKEDDYGVEHVGGMGDLLGRDGNKEGED